MAPKFKRTPNDPMKPIENCLPSVTWGFGHSPIFKDKSYSILAVAWGPLVQLFVLNDVCDPQHPFYSDGFFVLTPDEVSVSVDETIASTKSDKSMGEKEEERRREEALKELNPYE